MANSNNLPLISVVMSTYMHNDYIEEAINSVWSQTYSNLEICIVDDCSPDSTFETLQRLQAKSQIPMKISRNPTNMELTATISKALSMATGKYIAFLSGDDRYSSNRFQDQIELMEKDHEMMVVYGNGRVFKDGETLQQVHSEAVKLLLRKQPVEILDFLYTNPSPLFIQTLLVRRDFILSSGSFDKSVLSDDWVLNIRFFRSLVNGGKFAFIDKEFFQYRIHDTNVHKRFWRHTIKKIQVIQKYAPSRLYRTGMSNILFDISLNCVHKGWPVRTQIFFILSQIFKSNPQRRDRLALEKKMHRG